jgi:cytochrome c biogenesis protein CcmG/thiol:disulfide interchange protein DsbE
MSKKKHRIPRKRTYPVVPMAIGLLLIGLAVLALAAPRTEGKAESLSSSQSASINYAAPQLSLENINGKTESLADYRGDVVLVNNWATWCPPCKAEMPTLAAYYSEHREEGFTIIAIEAGDPADAVAQFAQSYKLSFPIWLDPNGESLRAFGNGNLPNSYLIDRSGIVRYAWTGEVSKEMLEKYVTPLLTEAR